MMLLGMLILAGLGTVVALAGCQSAPAKTPQDVWIEQHPTHLDEFGRCVEADGELCDRDPFDLDDFFELERKTPSASKRAVTPSPARQSPKPRASTRR
jgi:hypothetical protein